MAGISLELRRMVRGNTALSWAKGGGYALLVSTGPWMLSMVAVALMAKLLGGDGSEHAAFFASVSYSQACSQILFMPLLLVFSRHLADGIYLRRPEVVGESLVAALLVTPLVAWPAALVLGDNPSAEQLTMVNGANAFAGACLGASRRHASVVVAYAAGYAVSCAGVVTALAMEGSNADCVTGFLVGQCALLALLLWGLRGELPLRRDFDFSWLTRLWRNPALAVGGLGLATGLWCEKFAYWFFAPDRVVTELGIGYCPSYDLPMFLAMLSATPGIAFFYLRLETGFADAMERLTDRLSYGAPLAEIDAAHDELRACVTNCMAMLCRAQGGITLFGLLFAEAVLEGTGVGAVQTGVWRVAFFGVFFLVLFVCAQSLLFYVNAAREAAWCSVCLLAVNLGLTAVFLRLGPAYHGVGFTVAAALSLLLSLFFLGRAVARLPMRMFRPR